MIVPSETVVELSRWQFAATALYHFLFVPLTLGLSFILAAMETVYVTTGRPIYKEMARFWGKLFAINFALGVATGLTMEFEFGTNWSFYSHFVGDIFGAPLAIEGLMAFFMEVDVRRPDAVRLGPPEQGGAPGRHLSWSRWVRTCRRCGSWWPTASCRIPWVQPSTPCRNAWS